MGDESNGQTKMRIIAANRCWGLNNIGRYHLVTGALLLRHRSVVTALSVCVIFHELQI